MIERTNAVVKNLSRQIYDISIHTDEILHRLESLSNRITQIDEAQICLQEELENIGRHRDAESITKCGNYIKKICYTLNTTKIALLRLPRLNECSSPCNICVMHLNTYKSNIVQVQNYLQLAIPYLYSFRDTLTREQLLHLFKHSSLQKGITILSTPGEIDQKKSCKEINQILNNFNKIFPNLIDEMMQIQSCLEESIKEEQLRRPSLRVVHML